MWRLLLEATSAVFDTGGARPVAYFELLEGSRREVARLGEHVSILSVIEAK